MLALLLTVCVCLLVPWLPVWLYRSLPRRPSAPVSEGQIQSLADALHHERRQEAESAVPHAPGATEVTQQPEAWPSPEKKDLSQPNAPGKADRRLTLAGYRWVNGLFAVFFIVGFLALGFGWAALLHILGEWHAQSFPPSVFLFKPFYGIVFATPAIFLGIFSAIPLLMLLARLFMGRRRFLEYLFWDEGRMHHQKISTDGMIALLSRLALIVGVVAAAFAVLALHWHVRLTEEAIVVQPLFGLREQAHPYNTVEQLVLTTHRQVGKEVMEGPDLGIRFSDGSTWSTGQAISLPQDAAERERIVDFLVRKTGKPLTHARLLKDVLGW